MQGRKARRLVPWLKQRPDGTYYIYWYNDQGRTERTSLRTTVAVEAQERYAEFLAQGTDAFKRGEESSRLSVAGALDDYMQEHVNVKVVDKGRQEDAIAHLKAFWGNRPLADIDIPASRAYALARRTGVVGGGVRNSRRVGSDSTIRRELVVLIAAANHALRWKRIAPTEMPSIELPAETPRGEATYLTKDELRQLLDAAGEPLRSFIEVAYYTGARRRSVERLTRFQVDLARGRINLTSAQETAAQKRSNKRRPIVPIDPKLRPTIERLLANAPGEFLFPQTGSPVTGHKRRNAPTDLYRPFKDLALSIGLPEHKTHPHVLRHSRATHLLQDGVAIYDVARLLGDTVATVEKVYGHHSTDYLAAAIAGAHGSGAR